ncbi:MAG: hypothetical protein JNL80_03070 [Phycisphaerae bacterium]|jgi:hypothetical protein|nr:hypothetical protein [Phycisphaerae bacterium]
MSMRIRIVTALTLLVTLGSIPPALAASVHMTPSPSEPSPRLQAPPQASPPVTTTGNALSAVDGTWIFVEDRTEGHSPEQMGPPMSSTFSMRVEQEAVILNGHGSGHRDVRIALDGSITEVPEANRTVRYNGSWKDGVFAYEVAFERPVGAPSSGIQLIRRTFRPTPEGLVVTVAVDPPTGSESIGLYRHAEDIPLPTPAKAVMSDLSWLAGAWVGTRSSGSSIEERWSPPLGGAMLAISRTVNTSGKMVAFEYLRIVEKNGGLVYVAQPGGAKGTEFVLTELVVPSGTETGPMRAVFDNPRHDYPKRIVYELSPEGVLSATTGFLKGGTPRRYDFKREGS